MEIPGDQSKLIVSRPLGDDFSCGLHKSFVNGRIAL